MLICGGGEWEIIVECAFILWSTFFISYCNDGDEYESEGVKEDLGGSLGIVK